MPKKKGKSDDTLSSSSSSSDSKEPWKRTQMRTFTNWANDKLKDSGVKVSHLTKDLADGIKLIRLLEALSGKSIVSKK